MPHRQPLGIGNADLPDMRPRKNYSATSARGVKGTGAAKAREEARSSHGNATDGSKIRRSAREGGYIGSLFFIRDGGSCS